MEIVRAKEIILALLEGVDPTTGEVYNEDSIFYNEEVVGTFMLCLKGLEKLKKSEERMSNLPKNSGVAWTSEEDDILVERYNKGYDITTLAEIHKRTKGAITSRLQKHGLIDKL